MFRDKRSAETLSALMNAEQMEQLQKQLIRFIEQQKSALPKFWLSYMDMVSLLLRFVRASREGNWADHLVCIGEMLPWMFRQDQLEPLFISLLVSNVLLAIYSPCCV